MTFLARICRDYFGDGMPIQERQPAPMSRSEKWLTFCGAVFLIAVASFLPIRVAHDTVYCEDRKTRVLERCVLETNNFRWCWMHLTN